MSEMEAVASAQAPPAPGSVRVLFFGSLGERMGREVMVATPGQTVGDVWEAATAHCAGGPPSRAGLLCARNLEYCTWHDVVQPGDELAFMPPVCGGSTDQGCVIGTMAGAAPLTWSQG
ncbi:MAG: MoaD/ThiS family protein [Candidatus Dormibacteria bacterium]